MQCHLCMIYSIEIDFISDWEGIGYYFLLWTIKFNAKLQFHEIGTRNHMPFITAILKRTSYQLFGKQIHTINWKIQYKQIINLTSEFWKDTISPQTQMEIQDQELTIEDLNWKTFIQSSNKFRWCRITVLTSVSVFLHEKRKRVNLANSASLYRFNFPSYKILFKLIQKLLTF